MAPNTLIDMPTGQSDDAYEQIFELDDNEKLCASP
jgi:hypothetical protein